jgi:hypothetical protein
VKDERANLKALLEELANEEHRREPAHLTSDELRSYLRGAMTAEAHAQAQDHLVVCRHCADLLLALRGFAELEKPTGTGVSDAEVASAWEETKAIVGRHLAGEPRRRVERRRLLEVFRPAHAWATAASLLIALLAIGIWSLNLYRENRRLADALSVGPGRRDQPAPVGGVSPSADYERQVAELRQQVDTLSQPQPNVFVFDLYPADATRSSSSSDVTTMNVPAGANLITVILNTTAEYEDRDYSVDVLDQSGTRIWQGERLRKTAFGNFTLMVPRRFLPEGRYRIQLRGVGSGQATVIEQYAVRVRYP